jgi:hypothetical protein
LLCKDALFSYVNEKKLQPTDFLFTFSYRNFTKKLKKVARQVFGEVMTKGGYAFSELSMYDFRHSGACHWRLGAYRSKIDALMYRGGWSNLEMLNYYTKRLGMKDSIEKEDLLIGVDKTHLEQEITRLKMENETATHALNRHQRATFERMQNMERSHARELNTFRRLLAIHSQIAELGIEHKLKRVSDREYGRLVLQLQRELLEAGDALDYVEASAALGPKHRESRTFSDDAEA